jgi:hypothetical protein
LLRKVFGVALAALLVGPVVTAHAGLAQCPAGVSDVRGTNRTVTDIGHLLQTAAQAHEVPESVLDAIAFHESGFRQYLPDGRVVMSADSDPACGIGIMQVTASAYSDSDAVRLANDIAFNVDQGAKILHDKWVTAQGDPPTAPAGGSPDDPAVLENWYYPVQLYNGASGHTYVDAIVDILRDPFRWVEGPPAGWFRPVPFTRPQEAKADYAYPAPFQAQLSPAQQFVFYDATTKAVTDVVPAPTHLSSAHVSVSYPLYQHGPDDGFTTCVQCRFWRLADGDAGIAGRAHWTKTVTGTAQAKVTWDPLSDVPYAGRYRLRAYVPAVGTDTEPQGVATYTYDGGSLTLDQAAHLNAWATLGDVTLPAYGTVTLVDHSPSPANDHVGADAMTFSMVSTLTGTADLPAITYKGSTTVRFVMTHAGRPGSATGIGGYTYQVFKRPRGTSAWTSVGSYKAGAGGGVAVTVSPTVNAEYYASFTAPSSRVTSATSNVVRVDVRPIVGTGWAGTVNSPAQQSVPRGRYATLETFVTPGHVGQYVALQRWYSGAWHDVMVKRLNQYSAINFDFAKSVPGTYQYRVYKPADADHAKSAGRTMTLTVT